MSAVIPQNYAQWRHCIEVDCGIELTPTFISARLDALTRPDSDEARRFASLYGTPHLRRVLAWFHAALPTTDQRPPPTP